jgi:uncharacterized cofD-like protein
MVPEDAEPVPQIMEAIRDADIITVGPSSLYTSLIPNLLVRGIPRAIAESRALKMFICNLMTQPSESLGMTAADHIRAIHHCAKRQIFDAALVNTKDMSPETKQSTPPSYRSQ